MSCKLSLTLELANTQRPGAKIPATLEIEWGSPAGKCGDTRQLRTVVESRQLLRGFPTAGKEKRHHLRPEPRGWVGIQLPRVPELKPSYRYGAQSPAESDGWEGLMGTCS